jgi:GntR family transcriptional repressor for pyruvate dehydrogenase complex
MKISHVIPITLSAPLASSDVLSILASGLRAVKHDGMKGRMVEALTIDRKKLFEQVAAHLERQILEGKLRPGDQLPPERDLQARFGVGRPAIREALITLQRSGLLEIANGTRARVAMPTASAVVSGMGSAVRQMLSSAEGQRHFQGVRFFFETGLARDAARHVTPELVEQLRAALEANEAAIGDRHRFIETDVAFHFVLAQFTGNPIFAALHDAMSEWLKEQRVVTLEAEGQERIAFDAHSAIFRAIAAGDPDAAEAAMAAHLHQLAATFWCRQPAAE